MRTGHNYIRENLVIVNFVVELVSTLVTFLRDQDEVYRRYSREPALVNVNFVVELISSLIRFIVDIRENLVTVHFVVELVSTLVTFLRDQDEV